MFEPDINKSILLGKGFFNIIYLLFIGNFICLLDLSFDQYSH